MSGILNLPGLRELDKKESETEYHVKAEPAAIARLCPHCGELHRIQRHGNRPVYVRDLPTHGKTMMIHLDVPRLKCLACNKTFTAVVPEVDEEFQMTERLVRWIGRQSLEYTYAELAKQVGIDEKSVRTIFDAYVAKLEKDFKRETPVWLGIDEIKLGRFRAIFTNIQDRALIDMLPDRYHTSIVRFLESLPNKERITHISTDMWRPYRLAVLRVLPQAKPFRPVKTAFRNWKEWILNYFDDHRITNAFTESFNAKVRRVYRNGHGYTFERLRAKVLFTDRLQKRVAIQEKVKVKKQRFEDLSMGRMTYFMMSGTFDDDYEVKTKTRMANVGTDLPTLLALLDSDDF